MRDDRHPSPSGDDLVVVARADLDAVLARLDTVERELADLTAAHARVDHASAAAPPSDVSVPEVPGAEADPPRPVDRRRALLGLAGAAAAGAAAAVAPARPAAAANGDELVIGSSLNTATSPTVLTVGSIGSGTFGFGVLDGASPFFSEPAALFGYASEARFKHAVRAISEGTGSAIVAQAEGSGVGLRVSSADGVAAQVFLSRPGGGRPAMTVSAFSSDTNDGNTAILLSGDNHLRFSPNTDQSPPSSTNVGTIGAFRWTRSDTPESALWACIASGTPGTWRKITGLGTAGSLHVLPAPRRIYDSRPGTLPNVGSKTKLVRNTPRVLDLKVNGSTVPAGATGALLTILLVNAAAGTGNLTVWANGVARPAANTMVWGPAGGRFSTQCLTAVSAGAGIQVQANLPTDIVIDVVGYYR